MSQLSNFDTFRQHQDDQDSSTKKLLNRIAQVEQQIKLSLERQQILQSTNRSLSQIIINHNQKRQLKDKKFINKIELIIQQREQRNSSYKSIQLLGLQQTKGRKPDNKVQKKHHRVRTEVSEENNCLVGNTHIATMSQHKEFRKNKERQQRKPY